MAERHIWPAIGNPNAAEQGRQGFLAKNTTWSEPNLRSKGETEGGDFFIKTRRASEVKRSEDLAD